MIDTENPVTLKCEIARLERVLAAADESISTYLRVSAGLSKDLAVAKIDADFLRGSLADARRRAENAERDLAAAKALIADMAQARFENRWTAELDARIDAAIAGSK